MPNTLLAASVANKDRKINPMVTTRSFSTHTREEKDFTVHWQPELVVECDEVRRDVGKDSRKVGALGAKVDKV